MIGAANPVFGLIVSPFKLRMRLKVEILVPRHEPRILQRRRAVASDGDGASSNDCCGHAESDGEQIRGGVGNYFRPLPHREYESRI
jgi:hypothetical protein